MKIEDVRGAVARGWCHEGNTHKEMDCVLAEAISQEVVSLYGEPSMTQEDVRDYVHKLNLQDGDTLFVDADAVEAQTLAKSFPIGIGRVYVVPVVVPHGKTVSDCVAKQSKLPSRVPVVDAKGSELNPGHLAHADILAGRNNYRTDIQKAVWLTNAPIFYGYRRANNQITSLAMDKLHWVDTMAGRRVEIENSISNRVSLVSEDLEYTYAVIDNIATPRL